MNKLTILIGLAILSACSVNNNEIKYPNMEIKSDVNDKYFGTLVADPYRWLEDDNSDNTKQWVDAQNEVTNAYLEKIPFRNKIKERLTQIWDYSSKSAPFKRGNYWLEFRNDGKQNQSVLYIRENLEDEARILLDPNTLSNDGTVSLGTFSISKDGKYFAYTISRSGSDWVEIFVKDIALDKLLDDHIVWAKFTGISWFKDGFYYTKYPEPKDGEALKGENINAQIYYHNIGTSQEHDVLVYEDKQNPNWGFSISISEDEKYAFMYTTESTSGKQFSIFTPDAKRANPKTIIQNFDNEWYVIGNIDNKLLIKTNWNAPKYQLLAINADDASLENASIIIPEVEETLLSVNYTGGKLFAGYLKDAKSLIKVFDSQGKFENIIDTGIGSISGFSGNNESTFTFYTLTSFTTPSDIYKYNIETGKSELYQRSGIKFDGAEYETKQVFYTSKDGTKIPMFIVHKKGIELNGNNPTLLYGYGGFNSSVTPSFSVVRLPWLENGGILAVANIRGGGEYGEAWHKSGTKMQKQNVFDDFIAAAQYLQNERYTSPKKLAINGGSNGGLLIGACMLQRPDLFAVALPAVGVLDMLRYQYFTIGRYWATDYGTSEDSKEMFEYLYKYSPLHNIKDGQKYPATLITTGDHDDRVVPAHSFKFAATLQEKASKETPLLIMISKNAGHGAGKPKSKIIEEYANIWTFTLHNMNEIYK